MDQIRKIKVQSVQISDYIPFNIASGSEANITTPCEMDIFNFLWLIWDHYIP